MLGFELIALPAAFMYVNSLACAPKVDPDVDIIINSKPVHHDNSKTITELSQLFTSGQTVFDSQHAKVAGLHRSNIPRHYQLNFKITSDRKQSCIHLTDVTVTIDHSATIYIAKEYLDDRCLYNTVLKHELQHEKIDQQTLRRYKHNFYRAARAFAKENSSFGPFPADQLDAKKQELVDLLGQQLEPIEKEWWHELRRRQAKIDTPQEYKRLSDKCHNKKSFQKRQERYSD